MRLITPANTIVWSLMALTDGFNRDWTLSPETSYVPRRALWHIVLEIERQDKEVNE